MSDSRLSADELEWRLELPPVDVGRIIYWQVRAYLIEQEGVDAARGHRQALRAAQLAFLKLATSLELREIARKLGISYRTAKRANALLRATLTYKPRSIVGPGPIPPHAPS